MSRSSDTDNAAIYLQQLNDTHSWLSRQYNMLTEKGEDFERRREVQKIINSVVAAKKDLKAYVEREGQRARAWVKYLDLQDGVYLGEDAQGRLVACRKEHLGSGEKYIIRTVDGVRRIMIQAVGCETRNPVGVVFG